VGSLWTFRAPVSDGTPEHEATLQQRLEPNAVGVGEREPSPVQRVRLTFTYPERLRENETGVVTLRYERVQEQRKGYAASSPIITTALQISDREITAELASSGFKIAPASAVKREKGVSLPLVIKWTITPEKEGQHALVLDVSDMFLRAMPKSNDQVTTDFMLNGAQALMRDEGVVDLPIKVTTQWGVSQIAVSLVSGFFALLAFVVSYPVLVAWLKRRAGVASGDE
jgi:hypothetical protein